MSLIRLPEPMTRFQCNLEGCCCWGWAITFDADDAIEFAVALDPETQRTLLAGARLTIDDATGQLRDIRLAPVDALGRCRFLAQDGRCHVHASVGPEPLPNLCKTFPAFAYDLGDARELHYDIVCPEVLARIDESDEPYRVVTLTGGEHRDAAMRATRCDPAPEAAVAGETLPLPELRELREQIIEAFNQRAGRAAIDVLADVSYALARRAHGEPFRIDRRGPLEPFEEYLEGCLTLHHAAALGTFLGKYQRFVFDEPLRGRRLTDAIEHLGYDPGWRAQLDPRDPAWDGLLARYLAHRFFSCFDRSRHDDALAFSYGTITFNIATALRVAVGFSKWLERPVDRTLLKVALGASYHFYRAINMLPSALPWFGLDLEDAPPVL